MKNVCVVGVGLIGGSLGLSLRQSKSKSYRVTGVDVSKKILTKAKSRGAIDQGFLDFKLGVQEADVVVLCVPVQRLPAVLSKVIPFMKENAVLTDVGSVKGAVFSLVKAALRKRPDIQFVGGHPIAGSEKSGVENASKDLFAGVPCVMTLDGASGEATKVVQKMWRDAGGQVFFMSAKRHDQVLSLTSHLPHLIAYALMSVTESFSKNDPLFKKLFAGAFRDATRVAGSDGELWSGIFSANKPDLKKMKQSFSKNMDSLLALSPSALSKRITTLAQLKKQF